MDKKTTGQLKKQQLRDMIEIIDENDIGMMDAQIKGIAETQACYCYNQMRAMDIIEIVKQAEDKFSDQTIERVKSIIDNLLQ